MMGAGSHRLEVRILISQFHARRSAAQTRSKVISGISRPGVLSWVPHLFRVSRNPVPTSPSQINAAQSLDLWRVPHQMEKLKWVPETQLSLVELLLGIGQPSLMKGLLRIFSPGFRRIQEPPSCSGKVAGVGGLTQH